MRIRKEGHFLGVCVAAKASIRIGNVGCVFGLSPPSSLGRLSGAWVQVGPDTGILVLSVFFCTTLKGAIVRNKNIVRKALSVAANYGSPWIIAGDLNMAPSVLLHRWGPMIELADAFSSPPVRPPTGLAEGLARR